MLRNSDLTHLKPTQICGLQLPLSNVKTACPTLFTSLMNNSLHSHQNITYGEKHNFNFKNLRPVDGIYAQSVT